MPTLKQQLADKTPILGTFVKTPHYHITEVLSLSELDVLCLDAEHAPFDRIALDSGVLSCRAGNMPVLVRVPNDHPDTLLNALDIGAQGVVVPHVKTAEQLQNIVRNSKFGDGGRGYAGSTRAAGYTSKKMPENLAANQRETVVIAQIEDLIALDNLEAICQVQEVDCLFIGRVDLTVALGETDLNAPSVITALERIIEVANNNGVTTGMFVADLSELPSWISRGVSLFLLSSDHGFLLSGAKQLSKQFQDSCKNSEI